MPKVFRKIAGLFVVLAIFISANHCAFEELASWYGNASNCCPIENDNHPHSSPCDKLTSITNESALELNKLSSLELRLSLQEFFSAFSLKNHLENQFLVETELQQIEASSIHGIGLLSSQLILSPNAPPLA